MRTLIDKINYFEAGTETVEEFNKVFDNCPLGGYYLSDIVTIGAPCSPETTRELMINGDTFRHDFKPQAPEFKEGQTGEYTARKAAGLPFWKNSQGEYASQGQPEEIKGENSVMTKREMELRPIQYFLLQYFRGFTSNQYTRDEISKDLGVCVKTLGLAITEMEEEGIVTVVNEVVNRKKKKIITINQEWV